MSQSSVISKASVTVSPKKEAKAKKKNASVPVLYQNLNGSWYAFAEYEGQVFCGRINQKVENLDRRMELEQLLNLIDQSIAA